jgi:cold-inducible RNA-binding protein
VGQPAGATASKNGGDRRFSRQQGWFSMKLYVGNFTYDMTEDRLRDLFTPFGTPDSVALITDRATGRTKGFGFVEFSDDQQAKAAISAMNRKEVDGRALTVSEARPRNEGARPGGGGRDRY